MPKLCTVDSNVTQESYHSGSLLSQGKQPGMCVCTYVTRQCIALLDGIAKHQNLSQAHLFLLDDPAMLCLNPLRWHPLCFSRLA